MILACNKEQGSVPGLMWSFCNCTENATSKTWMEISPVSSSLMWGSRAKPTFLNDCHLLCCCISPRDAVIIGRLLQNQTDTWLPLDDRAVAARGELLPFLFICLSVWIQKRPVSVQTWIHEYIKVVDVMALAKMWSLYPKKKNSIDPFLCYKQKFTRTICACVRTSVAAFFFAYFPDKIM